MAAQNNKAFPVEEYRDDDDDDMINGVEEDEALLEVPPEPKVQQRKPLILLEIPTLLYFVALINQFPIVQFWLVDHFSEVYHFEKGNDTDYCGNGSQTNDSNADLENEVQSQANKYVMYTGFLSNVTAILPTLLLGALTDKFGRKFVFCVSFLGLLASQLTTLMVFLFNLTPNLLLLSSFFLGLSGNYGLFLAAVFGMVADITSPGKQRAFRVAVVEAFIALSGSVGMSTSGIWVTKTGYVWPMTFSMGLIVLASLFIMFLIPETLAERNPQPLSCKTVMKCFVFYVKDTPNKRRFKLIICIICFMIIVWCFISESNFGLLFLLHQPFCWLKDQITIFNGVLTLVKWTVVMIFLMVGKRWISEPVFAMIGCLSFGSGYLLKGLAQNNVLIFVAAGTSLLTDLTSPMCRTMMSKAVSRSEQGALFAGIGVLQMIVSAVSGVVMSNIYNASLGFYLGLPYLVLTGLIFISVCLFVILIIRVKLRPELEQPSEVTETIIN